MSCENCGFRSKGEILMDEVIREREEIAILLFEKIKYEGLGDT